MIFVSYWFLAFAAAFFPLYWLVRSPRVRLAVLAVGSVVFHGHFAGAAGVPGELNNSPPVTDDRMTKRRMENPLVIPVTR